MRLLMALAVLSQGCAAIVNGSRQDVYVTSVPSGAEIRVNDVPTGTTPMMLELPRKDPPTLRLALPGHQSYEMKFERGISKWVIGSLVLGGGIGILVDAANGGLFYLEPEKVDAELTPLRAGVIEWAPPLQLAAAP